MSDPNEPHFDLFISFALDDLPWVQGYLLPSLGLPRERVITKDIFDLTQTFALGAPQVVEFEQAVVRSRHTVLVISPAYHADRQTAFGQMLASHLSVSQGEPRVIPLLLKPCPLPLHVDFLVKLDCTDENLWPAQLDRLRQLLGQPAPLQEKIPCPYPGMKPFLARDSRLFHGRQLEIDELLGKLRHQRYLYVIGPSGSGKSSLIAAGVLPRVQGQGGSMVRSVRPGEHPLAALAEVLGGDPLAPGRAVADLVASLSSGQQLLLFIDPFEEVFTLAGREEQGQFFAAIDQLRKVAGCTLLIAMRSEFYPDLMNSALWPVDSAARVEIAPLRGDALQAAIVRPAEQLGVCLEAGLLERLVQDAAEEPGVLPLLQETMVLLWEKREARYLSLRAYQALGSKDRSGLAVALERKADGVMADLSAAQKAMARRILVRLVQFGEGRTNTRRQQPERLLRAAGDELQLFKEMLQTLAENRLLTLSGDDDPLSETKVDLSHEALLSGWRQLQGWLDEKRHAEQTRRRLEAQAENWVALDRKGGLLDGVELELAERWLISEDGKELGHSQELEHLVKRSQARRRIRWASAAAGVAMVVVAVLVAYLQLEKRDMALEQSWLADTRSRASGLQPGRRSSVIEPLHRIPRLKGNLPVREAFFSLLDIPDLVPIGSSSLPSIEEIVRHQSPAESAAALADAWIPFAQARHPGSGLAWTGADEAVLVALSGWRPFRIALKTGQVELPFASHLRVRYPMALSRDGQWLAGRTLSETDDAIHVWDARSTQVGVLDVAEHRVSPRHLEFAPDGRVLVAVSDEEVSVWRMTPFHCEAHWRLPEAPKHGPRGIGGMAISPDGAMLALERSTEHNAVEIELWSLHGEGLLAHWRTTSDTTDATLRLDPRARLAFHPTGRALFAALGDEGIRRWSIAKRPIDEKTTRLDVEPDGLIDPPHQATRLSLSPDGRWMLVADKVGSVSLWDIQVKQRYVEIRPPEANSKDGGGAPDIRDLSWASSGRGALWTTNHGIQIWRFEPPLYRDVSPLRPFTKRHEWPIRSVGLSPSGRWLATSAGSRGTEVQLIDLAAADPPGRTLMSTAIGAVPVVFEPGDNLWLFGDKVQRWRPVDDQPNRSEKLPVFWVSDAAIDARGHRLALRLGTVLDLDDGGRTLIAVPDPLSSGAIHWFMDQLSPDGSMLLVGQGDPAPRRVEVFYLRGDGNPFLNMEVPGMTSSAISANSERIVIGAGQAALVFEPPQPRPVRRIEGRTGGFKKLALSPSGRYLASAGEAGRIEIWDVSTGARLLQLGTNDRAVGALSVSDGPDGLSALVCGLEDGTVRVWDLKKVRAALSVHGLSW